MSIESASMSSMLEKIDVLTIDGKFVMSSLASVAENDVYKINVRELPPGMYVIHAVDIDGSRGSGKFVKLE